MSPRRSPCRLKTSNLPVRPLDENGLAGEGSPRTAVVARHFQNLELEEQTLVPRLDIQNGLEGSMIMHHERHMNPESYDSVNLSAMEQPDAPTTTYHVSSKVQFQDFTTIDPPLEIPETPQLKPVSLPPLSSRPKSPPLSSSSLWWKDSEITGHDPKDPTDDGYGINGIGFIPTPAIANARAERRKRQVAEWRNREAREARQKRSDRRRRREMVSEISASINPGLVRREVRKVRFLEA